MKLWALINAVPPAPRAQPVPPERVLEELRRSAQIPIVRKD